MPFQKNNTLWKTRTKPCRELNTWEKIEALVDKSNATAWGGCWLWTGRLSRNGYGRTSLDGKYIEVHRLMYERYVGKIPDGLELDHWCRVRHCCRPGHLEAVTHAENMARSSLAIRTHCKHGHEFNKQNTMTRKSIAGRIHRKCKICQDEYNKAYYPGNKDKISAVGKEYRLKNKEHISLRNKKYAENNREHLAEYQRAYQQKKREYDRQRRLDKECKLE